MYSVEINDAEVDAALARLEAHLDNMSGAFDDIGEYMVRSTKERFTQGVSPDGVPWAPKSLATIAAYRQRSDSRNSRLDYRPLFGPTGALSSTISAQTGRDFAEIGSNMIYAGTMQFGASRGAFGSTSRGSPIPWGAIPARPFLGVSDQDRVAIIDVIDEWLGGFVDD